MYDTSWTTELSPPFAPAADVRVQIVYCKIGNYAPAAGRIRDSLRSEFPGREVATDLVPASAGLFEVYVEGRLVYSKKATSCLPGEDEIFYHVRAALVSANCPIATSPR